MHLVVAYGQPFVYDSWTYRQPDFWDYTVKQIQIARNLGKGVISILERHRDLGMMLISGEKVEVALQTATDTLQLVADGTPMRHKCDSDVVELLKVRGNLWNTGKEATRSLPNFSFLEPNSLCSSFL